GQVPVHGRVVLWPPAHGEQLAVRGAGDTGRASAPEHPVAAPGVSTDCGHRPVGEVDVAEQENRAAVLGPQVTGGRILAGAGLTDVPHRPDDPVPVVVGGGDV